MRKSTKLNKTLDVMRKPDARMIQTNHNGCPDYGIVPYGVRVEAHIARQIINHPQVVGSKDSLFPGMDQTWRMR
jgi:hypothetical protein